jgi:hypothetical protein
VVSACREKTCGFCSKESRSNGGDSNPRGRPKKTIAETIKKDLEINELEKDMVFDRPLWRRLIHVADPT